MCNSTNPITYKQIPANAVFSVDRVETLTDIGVYCLMKNHLHLLLKEKKECGISKFMQKFLTAYSMYFNIKNKRTGRLFKGPFKAILADDDTYLEYLYAYIHLNPIKNIESKWKKEGVKNKKKAVKYLEDYKYSSYADYTVEERKCSVILNKNAFPSYFEKTKDFDNYINDWLTFQKKSE